MSQEKVDRYKEQKKNRKKIMKKEKRMHFLSCALCVVIGVGVIGWIAGSGYRAYEKNKPVSYTEVDMSALTDYYSDLDVN
ncbi:MAG: hypothetical protein MR425_05145 [Lachnospiraceae bacterium]|nr:hypothetical protein [Lachnospiraceae bacterium]